MIVDKRLDAAALGAADNVIADFEGAIAHEQCGRRAHAGFHLRFDNEAVGPFMCVGPEFKHFGIKSDAFKQSINACTGGGADRNTADGSAPFFDHNAMLV